MVEGKRYVGFPVIRCPVCYGTGKRTFMKLKCKRCHGLGEIKSIRR